MNNIEGNMDGIDRKTIVQTSICIEKNCGKQFGITAGEMEFYSNKVDPNTGRALQLPKRCKDCRQLRRLQAQQGNGYGENH